MVKIRRSLQNSTSTSKCLGLRIIPFAVVAWHAELKGLWLRCPRVHFSIHLSILLDVLDEFPCNISTREVNDCGVKSIATSRRRDVHLDDRSPLIASKLDQTIDLLLATAASASFAMILVVREDWIDLTEIHLHNDGIGRVEKHV